MQNKQLPVVNASKMSPDSDVGSGSTDGGYYRSMGELQSTPEFEEFLHREFPQAASEFPEGVSRRKWMVRTV